MVTVQTRRARRRFLRSSSSACLRLGSWSASRGNGGSYSSSWLRTRSSCDTSSLQARARLLVERRQVALHELPARRARGRRAHGVRGGPNAKHRFELASRSRVARQELPPSRPSACPTTKDMTHRQLRRSRRARRHASRERRERAWRVTVGRLNHSQRLTATVVPPSAPEAELVGTAHGFGPDTPHADAATGPPRRERRAGTAAVPPRSRQDTRSSAAARRLDRPAVELRGHELLVARRGLVQLARRGSFVNDVCAA